jgi:site-specific recombinase XerD
MRKDDFGLRRARVNHMRLYRVYHEAGLDAVGWHSFRHSYRGMLDDAGANSRVVQMILPVRARCA